MQTTDPTFVPSKEWDRALPEELEFYHLGKMISVPEIAPFTGQAVGLDIYADPSLLLVVHFPKECEASVYAEFGNILACRLAKKLAKPLEGNLWVTPPKYFSFLNIMHNETQTLMRKCFLHRSENGDIPVEVLIYLKNGRNDGHA